MKHTSPLAMFEHFKMPASFLDNRLSSQATSKMPSAFQSYKPRHMRVYGSIIINNFGEVLLVRGRLSKKWSFPKGHCKTRESDLECAMRELYEETGLIIDQKHTSYHKLKGGSYFVFAVTGRPLQVYKDNREIEEVQWWPISQICHINSNVDVSIFNTLMKNIKNGVTMADYIDSDECLARETIITRSIT